MWFYLSSNSLLASTCLFQWKWTALPSTSWKARHRCFPTWYGSERYDQSSNVTVHLFSVYIYYLCKTVVESVLFSLISHTTCRASFGVTVGIIFQASLDDLNRSPPTNILRPHDHGAERGNPVVKAVSREMYCGKCMCTLDKQTNKQTNWKPYSRVLERESESLWECVLRWEPGVVCHCIFLWNLKGTPVILF